MEASNAAHQSVLDSFDYHAPSQLQLARIASVRGAAKNLALTILNTVPPGADRSAAIRKVREAMMTANAGIVLGPEDGERDARTGAAAPQVVG